MGLFYLLKKSFKNLLNDSLVTEKGFEYLPYLSSFRCHKDRRFGRCAWTYYEAFNQTLLTQKYQGFSPNTFYYLEGYGTTKQHV